MLLTPHGLGFDYGDDRRRELEKTHGEVSEASRGRARMGAAALASPVAVVALTPLGAISPASANTGTITVNGPSVVATISSPRRARGVTFTVPAGGQVVTVTANGGTFPGSCEVRMRGRDAVGYAAQLGALLTPAPREGNKTRGEAGTLGISSLASDEARTVAC